VLGELVFVLGELIVVLGFEEFKFLVCFLVELSLLAEFLLEHFVESCDFLVNLEFGVADLDAEGLFEGVDGLSELVFKLLLRCFSLGV
jgi:hypothetical protein